MCIALRGVRRGNLPHRLKPAGVKVEGCDVSDASPQLLKCASSFPRTTEKSINIRMNGARNSSMSAKLTERKKDDRKDHIAAPPLSLNHRVPSAQQLLDRGRATFDE